MGVSKQANAPKHGLDKSVRRRVTEKATHPHPALACASLNQLLFILKQLLLVKALTDLRLSLGPSYP